MIKCSNCGEMMSNSYNFCSECGQKLVKDSKNKVSPVYCDNKDLEEVMQNTLPYASGLYPQEIVMLYNVYAFNGFTKNNKKFSAIYGYGYYIISPDGLLKNLIDRGFIIEKRDIGIINVCNNFFLREILASKNIKPSNKKINNINLIKENFTEEEILDFFGDDCYYELSKESKDALVSASSEMMDNIEKHKKMLPRKTDIDNSNWENVYKYLFSQYVALPYKVIRNEGKNPIILNTIDYSNIDVYIEYNNSGYSINYFYHNTKIEYNIYQLQFNHDNITFYLFINQELFQHFNNVIFVKTDFDKYHYGKENFIVGQSENNMIKLSDICIKNKNIENIETYDESFYRIIIAEQYEFYDDLEQLVPDKKCDFKNDDGYYYFCFSTCSNLCGMLLENYFSNYSEVKKISKIFEDDFSDNYFVKMKKDCELVDVLKYMINIHLLEIPKIFGKDLYSFCSLLRFKIPEVMKKSSIVPKYLSIRYRSSYGSDYDLLVSKIEGYKNRNKLIEEIRKTFFYDKYFFYNDTFNCTWPSRYDYIDKFMDDVYDEKIINIGKEKYNDIIISLQEKKIIKTKWKSEFDLYLLVRKKYEDAIFQYRDIWLGQQSLDIYIPSLRIGIEYQGKQHYEPVEFFGGQEKFENQKKRDENKKKLCKENRVDLIEWLYNEKITQEVLDKKIDKH